MLFLSSLATAPSCTRGFFWDTIARSSTQQAAVRRRWEHHRCCSASWRWEARSGYQDSWPWAALVATAAARWHCRIFDMCRRALRPPMTPNSGPTTRATLSPVSCGSDDWCDRLQCRLDDALSHQLLWGTTVPGYRSSNRRSVPGQPHVQRSFGACVRQLHAGCLVSNPSKTLVRVCASMLSGNMHSETVGSRGPVLLEDYHLVEKLANVGTVPRPSCVLYCIHVVCCMQPGLAVRHADLRLCTLCIRGCKSDGHEMLIEVLSDFTVPPGAYPRARCACAWHVRKGRVWADGWRVRPHACWLPEWGEKHIAGTHHCQWGRSVPCPRHAASYSSQTTDVLVTGWQEDALERALLHRRSRAWLAWDHARRARLQREDVHQWGWVLTPSWMDFADCHILERQL